MVVHLPLEQAVEVRILVPQPIKHHHSYAVMVFFIHVDLWVMGIVRGHAANLGLLMV
jgi:acetyl esterase/lipase